MNEQKNKAPGLLRGLIPFLISCAAIGMAVLSYGTPAFMFPAILLLILASAIKSWQKGIFICLLSYLRLVLAFGAGWLFKTEIGQLLNITGIFRDIAGFYATFLGLYFILGRMIKMIARSNQPAIFSKILGSIAGGFEGLVFGMLIFVALTIVPGSQLAEHQPQYLKDLTGSTEKILTPLLPDNANKAVKAMKTMSRLSKGIDPQKVDIEKMSKLMRPVAEMPEMQEVQNNPEVQQLIAEKNMRGLFKHPAVRKLIENPQLQEKIMNLDWEQLEQAIDPALTNP